MSRRLTRLRRPISRVVGQSLVVTLSKDGVELRGLRKRVSRKFLTWEQIASLDADHESLCRVAECNAGTKELERLGASPADEPDHGGNDDARAESKAGGTNSDR